MTSVFPPPKNDLLARMIEAGRKMMKANRMTDTDEWRVIDANVEAVRQRLADRAAIGLSKYGVTTERGDLSLTDWLTHLQEELMDAAVYTQAAITNADTLARQLAEARTENERLRKAVMHHEGRASEFIIRCAVLEQKAKRYDWIRDCTGEQQELVIRFVPGNDFGYSDELLSGELLDQAIDAAIAAGEK